MQYFLMLLFCGVSASLAAENSQVSTNGPRIVFAETHHDFGEVDPQILTHEFRFTNSGDQALVIQKVQTSCGCTVTEVSVDGTRAPATKDGTYRILPGHQGSIRAELNSAGFKGHIVKEIAVTSNDPKTPNLALRLVATLKQDVMVLPGDTVWWNNLREDALTNIELEIRSALPESLTVTNVETSAPWLTAQIVSASTNSIRLLISTKPPLPVGWKRQSVTLHTQYENYRTIVIPVIANVPPIISVVPPRLAFTKSSKEHVISTLLLERRDGDDFHITKITSEPAALWTWCGTNQLGLSYRVVVRLLSSKDSIPDTGTVTIFTDEPRCPKLEVPVDFR